LWPDRRRQRDGRAVSITSKGERGLSDTFGINLADINLAN
jgi:hypothetical protein